MTGVLLLWLFAQQFQSLKLTDIQLNRIIVDNIRDLMVGRENRGGQCRRRAALFDFLMLRDRALRLLHNAGN